MTRPQLGATPTPDGVRFAVWSATADRVWVSVFDADGNAEVARHELRRGEGDVHELTVPGLAAGTRYGYRADGRYDPPAGFWFDPQKLLVDPYAIHLDQPYRYDPALAAPRGEGTDTAPLVPKAIVSAPTAVPRQEPLFRPGGLIYEVNVGAFTMRHPDIPEGLRGTVAALAHPRIIEHMQRLGVSAVELMPVTAWIDESHLPPLGLMNAWGYNPVTFMALDPRLAPGGIDELWQTVAALRDAGIGTILDLVFNHTGESDEFGPTLSLRGLDSQAYYRHDGGRLVNDTGTGNTLACDRPVVRDMILDSLRHFVLHAGVDGFRFDLAPILGRDGDRFDPDSDVLRALRADPVLFDRVMIAEPWDIGIHGYQLGNFRPPMLEWNDKFRDGVRRFWRSDRGTIGEMATRLAGSSDVFQREGAGTTRSVNFVAAHDGFTLADLVSYERKHNEPNGERNRDGHAENFSWNNGVEGPSDDQRIGHARRRDAYALLATLFTSRGTLLLTAGDEFGRTQRGNNNAYAQDNETNWLDWAGRDLVREEYVAGLATVRDRFPALREVEFLTGNPAPGQHRQDVAWLNERGGPLSHREWEDPSRHRLTMVLADSREQGERRLGVVVNGDRRACVFSLPAGEGLRWSVLLPPPEDPPRETADNSFLLQGRTVVFFEERPI
ncbi:glycogen debranching protein GlgX [Arvimicrobium flavum]|uniref:glycogen debranching protein GlgX n=1 Tax=Arvimicrobium flavum TaxID=3393320 RepID=UPI00237B5551|nr:glycogen debranching protein GlgX [Mesorhizobium shangrilense]